MGVFGLDAHASPPYNGLGWSFDPKSAVTSPTRAIEPYIMVYAAVVAKTKQHLVEPSPALNSLFNADVNAEFESLVSTGANDIEV